MCTCNMLIIQINNHSHSQVTSIVINNPSLILAKLKKFTIADNIPLLVMLTI